MCLSSSGTSASGRRHPGGDTPGWPAREDRTRLPDQEHIDVYLLIFGAKIGIVPYFSASIRAFARAG
jgi:hypothetical protein